MSNRVLEFIYQDDGQIEEIAFAPYEARTGLISEGYRNSGIPDLMIDLHPVTQKPYCFMSLNFHKSYPVVIWGLRLLMNEERLIYHSPACNKSRWPSPLVGPMLILY